MYSLQLSPSDLYVPPTMLHIHFLYPCNSHSSRQNRCVVAFVTFQRTIVAKLCEVVNEYQKRLQEVPFLPRSSYGRPMLREDGGPNRNFLIHIRNKNWSFSPFIEMKKIICCVFARIYSTEITNNLTFETFLLARPVHQKHFCELRHFTATYTIVLRLTH